MCLHFAAVGATCSVSFWEIKDSIEMNGASKCSELWRFLIDGAEIPIIPKDGAAPTHDPLLENEGQTPSVYVSLPG